MTRLPTEAETFIIPFSILIFVNGIDGRYLSTINATRNSSRIHLVDSATAISTYPGTTHTMPSAFSLSSMYQKIWHTTGANIIKSFDFWSTTPARRRKCVLLPPLFGCSRGHDGIAGYWDIEDLVPRHYYGVYIIGYLLHRAYGTIGFRGAL
jgi:hypothetical protein